MVVLTSSVIHGYASSCKMQNAKNEENSTQKGSPTADLGIVKDRHRRRTVCAYTNSAGATSSRGVCADTNGDVPKKQRGGTVRNKRTERPGLSGSSGVHRSPNSASNSTTGTTFSLHTLRKSLHPFKASQPKQVGERLAHHYENHGSPKKSKTLQLSHSTSLESNNSAQKEKEKDLELENARIKEEKEAAVRSMVDRLGYLEDDKPPVPGITVRAASLDKLVVLTTNCFSSEGELLEGKFEFLRVFFLMHQWFLTNELLASKYMDIFSNCDNIVSCVDEGCQHTEYTCVLKQLKLRACSTVRFWIDTFPVHFDLNNTLTDIVRSFQETLDHNGESRLRELLDISNLPSYDWKRIMSVRPQNCRNTMKSDLIFNSLQPDKLAEQLTFLEFKAFRRVGFEDFKNYADIPKLAENPKLERSVGLCNGLSQWIQCMVLCKTTPQQRSEVIVKFIHVARKLHELQNYNTMMSVVGGLTHSALARLNKTNSCITPDVQKLLQEYTELLSSKNNFINYRKELQTCKGFRIPILGVHLKDLILTHTALPDKIECDLVNFRKMAQLSLIFHEILHVEQSTLPFDPNMDLVNTIRLSLDLQYTEDEIYELSLAREPRNSLSSASDTSPTTPTKPLPFGAWATGIGPPEEATVTKHVTNMIESVFKIYDTDKDGFISQEEFEGVSGNFPFIDSFCVLDTDQDGMISKEEMQTYFVRANCHLLRKCFKHDFHETTYFKPTFCVHCTGLLWGIIKQGWKCKDCGANAHKHCKDLVVMECRRHTALHGRPSHGMNGSPPNPYQGHPNRKAIIMMQKRKMNMRPKSWQKTRGTQTAESRFSKCGFIKSETIKEEDENAVESTESETESMELDSSDDEEMQNTTGFYEEQEALYERLLGAEEDRDRILQENKLLRTKVDSQSDQIATLKSHIGVIRQHTIKFILDQMDTLHMQRDTEV